MLQKCFFHKLVIFDSPEVPSIKLDIIALELLSFFTSVQNGCETAQYLFNAEIQYYSEQLEINSCDIF